MKVLFSNVWVSKILGLYGYQSQVSSIFFYNENQNNKIQCVFDDI